MVLLTAHSDDEVRIAAQDAADRGALVAVDLLPDHSQHWVEYLATNTNTLVHLVFDPEEGL